jgi:hypothetical protein
VLVDYLLAGDPTLKAQKLTDAVPAELSFSRFKRWTKVEQLWPHLGLGTLAVVHLNPRCFSLDGSKMHLSLKENMLPRSVSLAQMLSAIRIKLCLKYVQLAKPIVPAPEPAERAAGSNDGGGGGRKEWRDEALNRWLAVSQPGKRSSEGVNYSENQCAAGSPSLDLWVALSLAAVRLARQLLTRGRWIETRVRSVHVDSTFGEMRFHSSGKSGKKKPTASLALLETHAARTFFDCYAEVKKSDQEGELTALRNLAKSLLKVFTPTKPSGGGKSKATHEAKLEAKPKPAKKRKTKAEDDP